MKPFLFACLAALAVTPSYAAAPDITVFGITMGKRLPYPECTTERVGDLTPYSVDQKHTCWKAEPAALGEKLQFVTLQFHYLEQPAIVSGSTARVALDSELVDAIYFDTAPLSEQNVIMRTLVEKFGKPSSSTVTPLQNGFGARFEAISAHWNVGTTTVNYDADGGTNTGRVEIESDYARMVADDQRNQDTQARIKF